MKKIKLQKDILDDYPELLQANVFENVESVYLICEIILLSNPRQSLNILQMLKISLNGFLSHILSKFSYENRLNSIEETLQTFAELKRKNLIPEALKLTDNEVMLSAC